MQNASQSIAAFSIARLGAMPGDPLVAPGGPTGDGGGVRRLV